MSAKKKKEGVKRERRRPAASLRIPRIRKMEYSTLFRYATLCLCRYDIWLPLYSALPTAAAPKQPAGLPQNPPSSPAYSQQTDSCCRLPPPPPALAGLPGGLEGSLLHLQVVGHVAQPVHQGLQAVAAGGKCRAESECCTPHGPAKSRSPRAAWMGGPQPLYRPSMPSMMPAQPPHPHVVLQPPLADVVPVAPLVL